MNKNDWRDNYSVDNEDSFITPYIRIYENEWGKECNCIHLINGNNPAGISSTFIFGRDTKYNQSGVDKYPNTINYEPLIVEGVEYCPVYSDYWQQNRTFTIVGGTYWVRFSLYKWNTKGAKFTIGDRILWESNIK